MQDTESPPILHDQLGFFLFLACALHLLLILGVGFSAGPEFAATPQLEVTLSLNPSRQAPDQARFIAQSNQEGSGTLAHQAELTTRRQAPFSDNRIRETDSANRRTKPQNPSAQPTLVDTINDAVDKIFLPEDKSEPGPVPAEGLDPDIFKLSQSIANLEARLDEQEQAHAERPRVRRLTSLSAKAAVDAAYLQSWRARIESIGNRYYPLASSRYGIYGDLRLLVAVRFDGTIETIEILSSSGHAVLDEAAIKIVRMSAPFEPFPPQLRETTDLLEIIRTWKFRQNRLNSTQG